MGLMALLFTVLDGMLGIAELLDRVAAIQKMEGEELETYIAKRKAVRDNLVALIAELPEDQKTALLNSHPTELARPHPAADRRAADYMIDEWAPTHVGQTTTETEGVDSPDQNQA